MGHEMHITKLYYKHKDVHSTLKPNIEKNFYQCQIFAKAIDLEAGL